MPEAIDPIIKQYLQGVSRDTIRADNAIGTGTASNVIDEHNGRYPCILGGHCTFCIPQ